jgi:DNA polymerase III alpha subunit
VKIFYDANTFGVFYFESPATRQTLKKVSSGFTFEAYGRMDHFQLNVVVTSIIRPASNQSIRDWVARLHGEPWEPPHPLLRSVLEETLGVMVFQEQLSQSAMSMAGFDAAEADTLRKVVSKKHREKKLRDFYARFAKGASERGVSPEKIEEVWQMMMGFEGYSFCKPHSASYTMVAYKSAYLRAHYPAEFMAAVISNGGGYYSTFGYLSEARRMGLTILPPDINQSEIKYTGKNREVRVGLMQLKDLSRESLEFIVRERSKHGPFTSLDDFLFRTSGHVHLQDARVLIKAGCFDGMAHDSTRPALMWKALRFFDTTTPGSSLDLFEPDAFLRGSLPYPQRTNDKPSKAVTPAQAGVQKRFKTLDSRLRGNDEPSCASGGTRHPSPYPRSLMLKHEIETLGFYLSIHPLDRCRNVLKGLHHVNACDLHLHVGKHVTMVGWLVTGKTVQTKDGDPMKFVSFEDTTGLYETVFFPKAYNRFCHMLNEMRPYLIRGKVEEDFTAVTLTVHWIEFMDRSKRQGPLRSQVV